MSNTVGITAFGSYIPWRRFDRREMAKHTSWYQKAAGASGERAWCGWDEDVLTMAVEAARDCLPQPGTRDVSAVLLASTTAPFADRSGAAIVRQAINASGDSLCLDVGGSYRAGTSALLTALRMSAGQGGQTLCVASERVTSEPSSAEELQSGDAAAAFVVGVGDTVIAEYLGSHSIATDFVDHFRPRDSVVNYAWESRWARDEGVLSLAPAAVQEALKQSDLTAADVDRFILPVPMKGAAASVAKKLGIRADAVVAGLDTVVGHCGTAAPLLELAHALEGLLPGQCVVVASFGSGCDALVLRRTQAPLRAPRRGVSGWLARRTTDNTYLKFLAAREMVHLSGGMRAEFDEKQSMPALWRNQSALLSLTGVRDEATGEVVFPPPAGSRPTEDSFSGVFLADHPATVTTLTADRLAYSLDPPTHYGVIDFDGGGRMTAEYCDVEPGTLAVGSTVRMMFRIKTLDGRRGFRSYFWKAAPELDTSTQEEEDG
ncbi:3-oxoacyl-[acyl-carrier-protein] synthase III C-terminal domain-containing protein [Arthrobacter sp. 18067]|uniref:3-oxoacyl-[acyl-carrier-protein] synthase III C-terminal domain-containing protein n=1 Tax=Arthrobacter sp. 18067 TaxID=2681413 RepID=UPI0013579C21|nr:3-oxoacyl-[acyl-carrier-protein] synthase III C-terminal domain-containing protein [Arthrobacter sp. 18067]